MPELEGRINGMSVRVPTFDCSLVDLTCEVEKPCDADAVNAALKAASQGALRDNMGFSEEPLVSIDYRGSTYGGVVDALSTQVLDQTMLKLLVWYDNEAGFTNQLLRLLRMVGRTAEFHSVFGRSKAPACPWIMSWTGGAFDVVSPGPARHARGGKICRPRAEKIKPFSLFHQKHKKQRGDGM